MANRDHKAGPRPSSRLDGSQTPSPHDPSVPRFVPPISYDPHATVLAVLTYIRDRLEERQWLVIPWGLPGEPIVGSVTREVTAALDIAVHSIELAARRGSPQPAVNA